MTDIGDVHLIKSFVWHGGKCFFVSTIDRDSSNDKGGRFSETAVWDFDWDKQDRGGHIQFETSGVDGVIKQHLELCQRIFDTGKFEDETA